MIQIWNQKRPGWVEALINPLLECLKPAKDIIFNAAKVNSPISFYNMIELKLVYGTNDN